MKFELELFDDQDKRHLAIFDTHNSSIVWADTHEKVFPKALELKQQFSEVKSISPLNPGEKSRSPKLIKIQLGLACNYSCHYCSQSIARAENGTKLSEQLAKTELFLKKFDQWFIENPEGSTIEFWGGETLLYWPAIKIISKHLRQNFKNIKLGLFTNGSIISDEIINDAVDLKIHFVISHDGEISKNNRGRDPFHDPQQLSQIRKLFQRLHPLNLISFNSTLTPNNYSHLKIREYISNSLNVEASKVNLSSELYTAYDQQNADVLLNQNTTLKSIYSTLLEQYPFNLGLGNIDASLMSFFSSIESKRPIHTFSQKCSMDLPTSITIDLDGNVTTCQNVAPKAEHFLGNIDSPNEIKLTSSTHFLNRQDCSRCPVVTICQGSCMYLKESEWDASCEHHFNWSLAFLAFVFKISLNLKLVSISGLNIRNKNINSISVL